MQIHSISQHAMASQSNTSLGAMIAKQLQSQQPTSSAASDLQGMIQAVKGGVSAAQVVQNRGTQMIVAQADQVFQNLNALANQPSHKVEISDASKSAYAGSQMSDNTQSKSVATSAVHQQAPTPTPTYTNTGVKAAPVAVSGKAIDVRV